MADKFFAHPQLSDKSVRRYAGEDVASWVTSVDDSFGRSKAFTLLAALWSFSASVQGNAIDFQRAAASVRLPPEVSMIRSSSCLFGAAPAVSKNGMSLITQSSPT